MNKNVGDKLSPEEYADLQKKVEALQDEFLESTPALLDEMTRLKAGQVNELESRTVKLAMPPIFWNTLDKFIEIFEATEMAAPADAKTNNDIQMQLISAFMSKVDISLEEIVLSQVSMDSCIAFAKDIVKINLFLKLQDAIKSKDPEKLTEVVELMESFDFSRGDVDESDTSEN